VRLKEPAPSCCCRRSPDDRTVPEVLAELVAELGSRWQAPERMAGRSAAAAGGRRTGGLLEVRVPSKRLPKMEVELDADLRPDASEQCSNGPVAFLTVPVMEAPGHHGMLLTRHGPSLLAFSRNHQGAGCGRAAQRSATPGRSHATGFSRLRLVGERVGRRPIPKGPAQRPSGDPLQPASSAGCGATSTAARMASAGPDRVSSIRNSSPSHELTGSCVATFPLVPGAHLGHRSL
jgi:hypothetical protein